MEQSTALAPFNIQELATTVQSLPDVFTDAQMRSERAVAAANSLLEQAKNGMNDELDLQMVEFIKKARTTGELINKNRTPGTQLFQIITKSFTALESGIKDSIAGIEKQRNIYATWKAQEAKKREEEARKKAAIEREKSELAAEIEKQYRQAFVNYLQTKKRNILSVLESMSLATVNEASRHLHGFDESFTKEILSSFSVSVFPVYTDNQSIDTIKKEVFFSLLPNMQSHYANEIASAKRDAIDKIPSKKAELEALDKSNAVERQRMEQEAARRRKDEEDRLAQEAAAAAKKAEDEAAAKAQAGAMNAAFDAMASAGDVTVPKGKEEYEIVVTHQQGYAEMFAMWFTKEGVKQSLDQLEKVTMKKIRGYFEDLATKSGEKMESKFFRYEINFKTRVTR